MQNPTADETDSPRRTGQQRLGGRSERVIRDVLGAAVAELGRVGYAALRIDDVAAHAGVNKTTVYRRWPTKVELVGAALQALNAGEDEPPDTGAVRSDLLAVLRGFTCRFGSPEGEAVSRVIMLELADPEVAAIVRALREEIQAPAVAAVNRAVGRGELPRGTDPELMVETLMGAVSARKRKQREPVDDAFLAAIVELVVTGAIHGGALRKSARGRRTRPSR